MLQYGRSCFLRYCFGELLTAKPQSALLLEDNESCACIIRTGKIKNIAHVGRTHGVDLAFLTERLKAKDFEIGICPTRLQAADIFTKPFTDIKKWEHAMLCIGHVDPASVWGKHWQNRRAALPAAPR